MKKIDAGVAATGTALVVGILIFVVFFILPTRRERKKPEAVQQQTQQREVERVPAYVEVHETRKIWFDPNRPNLCLSGFVGDPQFYVFGGTNDITIEHEESGRTWRWNKTGWVNGSPGTLPVGRLRFCRCSPGSADSIHVSGLWRKTNY